MSMSETQQLRKENARQYKRIAELEAKLTWAMGLNACKEHERAVWAEAELAEMKAERVAS